MQFTDLFIRRPVLAMVVSLIICIAGLQAIKSLNVRQYPKSDNATVTVTTVYTGAAADLVQGFITTPLERAIAAADGIDYIQSQSSQGVSTIQVRLKLNHDATKALAEISSKVDQVRADLPPEAEVPIINIESADSRFASAYLSFTSDLLAQNQITDYLTRVVQPRLSALAGVQRADILGARTFAMRIWLKPDRLAAYGISPTEVRRALAVNNSLAALGRTKGSLIQINLSADSNLHSVEEFKRLVVRELNGAVVRIEDIAEVVLGAEDYDAEVRFSGQTAVFMGIWTLPSANSLDVIKGVKAEMAAIQKDLPSGMQARVAYDATEYIDNAIHEVIHTLADTLLIVVLIIFLFLGSFRLVLIPVMAIPLSLIGAVFVMQIFGFTINLLTLLAVVLSVGLVVDDAIVVVENAERHLREGRSPLEAALMGARELVGPIIAMTVTLVAVYLPIGLQGGLTGSLFREFAFTLAGAVTISGVVALTLSPMMSSKLLLPGIEERGLAGRISRGFERLKLFYGRVLDRTLRNRPVVYLVWVLISLLAVPMFLMSPSELAPLEDQGVIFGILDAAANSTLDQTSRYAAAANRVFMGVPEANFTFQITMPSSGFGGLVVKPWDQRQRTVAEILPEVQRGLGAISGVRMFPVTPPALPGGGQFPVEFVIASTAPPAQVLEFAQQIQQKAMKSGMFAFPPLIDMKVDQPQSELMIDRDRVADLGLSLQQVSTDLGALLGGNFVNRFDIAGRSYKVIPQIQRLDRLNPEQLENIRISGPDGSLVPLASVATIRNFTGPRSLNRFQQLNAVTISGVSIRPLDEALRYMEHEAMNILPKGYVLDYTGESRQLRTEGNRFLPAFGLAVVLIFLVLAAQFNSFRDPFIILAGSVPLAMFGALIFTFLKMPNPNIPFWTAGWTTTLNIYSQVGLVTLVGLVAKNGILIVEFANQLQKTGLDKLAAIRQAALTRLRPVLMTSCATVAGHFPLTLVSGAGAAARNSIGLVLVSGMAIGTLFTLLVVPSIYMLVARKHSQAEDRAETGKGVLPVLSGLLLCLIIGLTPMRAGAEPRGQEPPASVAGQELPAIGAGERLTLSRVIAIARRLQPEILAAQGSIRLGESRVGQAVSGYYPKVDGLASYNRIAPAAGSIAALGYGGGNFSQYSAGISANQMLYDFGRTETLVGIRRSSLDSSRAEFVATDSRVIFAVTSAYYDLLRAERKYAVALKSLQQFEQHLSQAKAFFEAGTKPRYDVTKAEVELGNGRLALIRAENGRRLARVSLNNAMGLSEAPPYELEDSLDFVPFSLPLGQALQLAGENRPDLKALLMKKRVAEQELSLAGKGYAPQLNGNAAASYSGENFPLDEGWNVGVSVSFPLFNGFMTRHQIGEAKASLSILDANERALRQMMDKEIRQGYLNLEEAAERVRTNERIVVQAEENYAIASGRYKAGVGNPVELADADLVLANARVGQIEALYDYRIAGALIERAVGPSPVQQSPHDPARSEKR